MEVQNSLMLCICIYILKYIFVCICKLLYSYTLTCIYLHIFLYMYMCPPLMQVMTALSSAWAWPPMMLTWFRDLPMLLSGYGVRWICLHGYPWPVYAYHHPGLGCDDIYFNRMQKKIQTVVHTDPRRGLLYTETFDWE
jgi:hypothetical protein